jgi:hypothetical protein
MHGYCVTVHSLCLALGVRGGAAHFGDWQQKFCSLHIIKHNASRCAWSHQRVWFVSACAPHVNVWQINTVYSRGVGLCCRLQGRRTMECLHPQICVFGHEGLVFRDRTGISIPSFCARTVRAASGSPRVPSCAVLANRVTLEVERVGQRGRGQTPCCMHL